MQAPGHWLRGLSAVLPRREFGRFALGIIGLAGIAAPDEAGAKRKRKRKKKTTAPPPTGCTVPYFDCRGECRLIGACCDGRPGTDCAERHTGEEGRWVCCEFAGYGCRDLDSDKFSCGACGTACDENEICCGGACRFGPGPCPPG